MQEGGGDKLALSRSRVQQPPGDQHAVTAVAGIQLQVQAVLCLSEPMARELVTGPGQARYERLHGTPAQVEKFPSHCQGFYNRTAVWSRVMLSPVTFPGFSRLLMLLLVLVSFPATALAQSGQPGPEELADRAVTQWREGTGAGVETLAAMGTVELCEAIPALLVNPPPPAGTRVNLDDRLALPTDDPDRRLYSYSAVGPADQLAVVQVDLQLSGDNWQVSRVGFRQAPPGGRSEEHTSE